MGSPDVEGREEMLIRHDERIAALEKHNADLAEIVQKQIGYQEGWWQARKDSFMSDIEANINAKALHNYRRILWIAVAALVTAIVSVAKGHLLP